MSDGLFYSQDILINACKIVTCSGQIMDFKNLVVELNYFEDIFSNGISGKILINDSMGYIDILELQGFEVLLLDIDKPGLEDPITKEFRIFNISNRKLTKSTNENYVINFCSEELLLNEQYRVSKSYKKEIVSNIVFDILTNNLKVSQDKIEIDITTGLRDIVIPNFKPIQAINWLCTFAKSDDYKNVGSPFLFYEDRDGLKFKSILNLFKYPVYKTYEYSVKGLAYTKNTSVIDIAKEVVNVLDYEHIKNFDSITAIRSGAFSNKMHTVDPLRLKLGESNFSYSDYIQSGITSLNTNQLPTSKTNRFGDTINQTKGVIKFCVTTTGQSENEYIKNKNVLINENRIEETVPFRTAQIALFCSHRMKLVIPGDVLMTVGKVIIFNLPEITYNNKNKQKSPDEFYSGKYLVTAVRHVFSQENKFITCIEICKESSPNRYADFNNSDSLWGQIS